MYEAVISSVERLTQGQDNMHFIYRHFYDSSSCHVSHVRHICAVNTEQQLFSVSSC